MSSDKETGAGLAAELERRDRKSERNETLIMAVNAVIAVIAVASIILWAFGWPLFGPGWAAIAAVAAVAQIYSQRTIRLLRRHVKEMRQHLDRAYDLLRLIRR